jgi:outer membrane protein assembly factor BamB
MKIKAILLVVLLSLVLIFSVACNGAPANTDGVKDTGLVQQSEEQKKAEEQKKINNEFLLGKDVRGVPNPNTVVLQGGKGNVIIETGELIYLSTLYIIDFQDNVEYRWISDDPSIVQVPKFQIQGIAPGTTHIRCVTRSGDKIADLTVTVMKSQLSRIVKNLRLDGSAYWSALTIKDNFIYTGTSVGLTKTQSEKYYFYKLDMDFNVVWKYDLGKFNDRGSAVLDSQGNIYFIVQDFDSPGEPNSTVLDRDIHIGTYFYSLTNDGKFRFAREITGKPGMYQIGMINCAITKDNMIYIADDVLYAFDTDGNVKWKFTPAGNRIVSRSSPVFDGAGNMYVLMAGVLYRFDAGSEGVPVWQATLADPYVDISPPSFNADYSRIIVPLNQTVYCLDPANGEKIWAFKPEGVAGEFRANAAVDAAGNIYIGNKANNESTLYAIKSDGSGLLWQTLVGGDLYCSPVLGDDGLLYIGSEASILGVFYAIKPATGEIVWAMAESIYTDNSGMEGLGFGSLKIQDGYIYCFSETLLKIKVEADNYLPGAGWACFRGSNDNSGYRK